MAISNCLLIAILEIPTEFSAWCVLAKFSAKKSINSRVKKFSYEESLICRKRFFHKT